MFLSLSAVRETSVAATFEVVQKWEEDRGRGPEVEGARNFRARAF